MQNPYTGNVDLCQTGTSHDARQRRHAPTWDEHLRQLDYKLPRDLDRARAEIRTLGTAAVAVVDGKRQTGTILNIRKRRVHLRFSSSIRILPADRILELKNAPFPKKGKRWQWSDILCEWKASLDQHRNGTPLETFETPPHPAAAYTIFVHPRTVSGGEPETVVDFRKDGTIVLADGTQHFLRLLDIVHVTGKRTPTPSPKGECPRQ